MGIWAAKLRFLFISKNMLKIIATTRSECTTKYENKASYNTDYIVSGLIDIFGHDWKEIRKQVEKRNIYICERLKISLLKAFFMYFLRPYGKIMFRPFVFPTKNQSQIHYFQNFLFTEYLKKRLKQTNKEATTYVCFDFLEKDLVIVSPPHFVKYFLRKMFPMLHSIN